MIRNRTVEEIRVSQLLELKDLANEAYEWRDKQARKQDRRLWMYPLVFVLATFTWEFVRSYCVASTCYGFQEVGGAIDEIIGYEGPDLAPGNYNFDSLPETAPPAETTYNF